MPTIGGISGWVRYALMTLATSDDDLLVEFVSKR